MLSKFLIVFVIHIMFKAPANLVNTEGLCELPRVSIAIPVFNGELTIRKTINALINQSYENFEILISDNASTDATEEICRAFVLRDPRIRYIRQPSNIGASANFRFLLNAAESRYFMFAAADDNWSPLFLEKLLIVMLQDEGCVLAFCDFVIRFRETGREVKIPVSSSCSNSPLVRYVSRIIDMQPHLIYGLFRRDYIKPTDLVGFDFFDCHISLIMALRGRIRIVNETLYTWEISQTRRSYSLTNKRIDYLSFFVAQLGLFLKHFSLVKSIIPIILLSYFLATKVYEHYKPQTR